MKHLLKLSALTPKEILHILDVADEYKRLHKQGVDPKDLQGKAVALIFAKNSTRTRTSLEVGIYQMGGLGTYLSANDLQTARGEPVQDTARALGRYYDAIVCRTYKQTTLDAMAQYSGVPVISGMTDYAHPLQVLTDLMTVRERKGRLAGLRAGFIGDGYNMANSMIVGCLAVGMTVTVACPPHYRPAADVLMLAKPTVISSSWSPIRTRPPAMPMCCSPMCGSVWAWSARWSSAAGISTGLRWMPPAWRWPSRTA